MGFARPSETTIGVDTAYSTANFRRPKSYTGEPLIFVTGPAPHFTRRGYLITIENETLLVSLIGRFGDYPPTDKAGFFNFAKELHSPFIYELIGEAEQLTQINHYRFPTSVQRHYERMTAFPEGFLVLGDAVCSFNPVYGQGMSSAALQVNALQQLLNERVEQSQGLERLALAFFPRAAEVIVTPWTLAATFDFLYPQTCGTRPPNLTANAQHLAAANAVAAKDIKVQRLLAEVVALAKPLAALW